MPYLERLQELLAYDPETGLFRWISRSSQFSHIKIGDVAGGPNGDGYIHIRVDGKKIKAHRLAWLFMTGSWPDDQIDHIDRDKSNNRWSNLRAATSSENACNRRCRQNATGFRGVTKNNRGYAARLSANGERVYLGTYPTAEEAASVVAAAASDLHGVFGGGATCL